MSTLAEDAVSFALQLAKFCAKMILLERGLLEAASGVDRIQPMSKQSQEGEGEGEETIAEDVMQDYHKKIQLYVQLNLAMASQSKRDHYKDTLVYQERKAVMSEFLKATLLKKCQNSDCEAYVVLALLLCAILTLSSQSCLFITERRSHKNRRT
jgi:DNA-directed RNA polymerase I subunit RPA1